MFLDSELATAGTNPAVASVPIRLISAQYEDVTEDGVQFNANPGVSEQELISIIDGTSVGVYVYSSQEEGETFSPSSIANQIKSETGKEVVIVQDTTPLAQEYGVAGDNSGKVFETLQSEGLEEGVIEAVAVVTQPDPAIGGEGGDFALPLGGGVLVGGVAIAAVVFWIRGKQKQKSREIKTVTTNTGSIQIPLQDGLPPKIKMLLDQMNAIIRKHHAERDVISDTFAKGGETLIDLEKLMATTVNNVQQLFIRLEKRGSTEKKRIAVVEYEDKLTKLIEGLGDNYFLDIAKDPNLWDNAVHRMVEVHDAVEMVNLQLIENIRQVNASKDLEFRVVLNALTGPKNNPTVKDIYQNNQGEN